MDCELIHLEFSTMKQENCKFLNIYTYCIANPNEEMSLKIIRKNSDTLDSNDKHIIIKEIEPSYTVVFAMYYPE